jgi:hypothetical protein
MLVTRTLHQIESLLRRSRPAAEVCAGGPGVPQTRTLVGAVIVLGAAYGLCMGLYGWLYGADYNGLHMFAVTLKVPALFLLTLVVTCPSLHVFSALARSTLHFRHTVRLLLAATATSLAVLASFGPVTAFFTFCTKSHPFMQLLNTALFAIAGLVGVAFVQRSLAELLAESSELATQRTDGAPQPRNMSSARVRLRLVFVFSAWTVIYAVVGAQMGWILRPFVGTPSLEQELFRGVHSNFFYGLIEALRYL